MMLDDIFSPKPRELARVFRVSERTVKRWIREEQAPMPVLMSLFWLTSWGQDQVHTHAHNGAILQAAIADNLRRELVDVKDKLGRELDGLNEKLARLGQIADFGSANDPAEGVALPAPPPCLSPSPELAAVNSSESVQPAARTYEDAQ